MNQDKFNNIYLDEVKSLLKEKLPLDNFKLLQQELNIWMDQIHMMAMDQAYDLYAYYMSHPGETHTLTYKSVITNQN